MHGQQGLVIGIVGAVGGPEVGYVIHPAFWGRGYATEALRGFLEVFWRGVPSASVSASETPTSGPTSAASAPAAPRARAEAEGRTHDIKAELAAPPSERRDAAPRLTDGVDYLQAITDPENVGSVRVLEKVGFVLWASLSDNFLSPHEGIGVRCTVVYRVARPGTSLGKGEGPFELGGEREGKQ